MKSIHRSNLARALMTGAASLAVMMASAADARAEIVAVQGDDGAAGADGVNFGDPGLPGGDGESVTANAGSTQPITFPLNKATATGGNGGQGGDGFPDDDYGGGGNGGSGGAANATASTAIISGLAEANANSFGGSGGTGGSTSLFANGSGGAGGGATATSDATSSGGNVTSSAGATGGNGGALEIRLIAPEMAARAAARPRQATRRPAGLGT
jgi:hypothetical protein